MWEVFSLGPVAVFLGIHLIASCIMLGLSIALWHWRRQARAAVARAAAQLDGLPLQHPHRGELEALRFALGQQIVEGGGLIRDASRQISRCLGLAQHHAIRVLAWSAAGAVMLAAFHLTAINARTQEPPAIILHDHCPASVPLTAALEVAEEAQREADVCRSDLEVERLRWRTRMMVDAARDALERIASPPLRLISSGPLWAAP